MAISVCEKDVDKISGNLLSRGEKVKVNGKIYNYFGYSKEKGYIVISSSLEESDFIAGKEFDRYIPIDLSHNRVDHSTFYKKIDIEQIEDLFKIRHQASYYGIQCEYRINENGKVDIVIDPFLSFCKDIPQEDVLNKLGFLSDREGNSQRDSRTIYVKNDISLDDSLLEINVTKCYRKELAYPFEKMKREYCCNKYFIVDMNIKEAYKKVFKEESFS